MDLSQVSREINDYLMTDANEFKTAMSDGGLWFTENTLDPDSVVYPYTVYNFIPGEADRDSADKWFKPIVEFVIYEDKEQDPESLLTHGKKLYERFVDSEASFNMQDYTMLSVDLLNTPRPEKGVNGDWIISYRFRLWLEYDNN